MARARRTVRSVYGARRPPPEHGGMNLLLTILLGTGAVIGALGMVLLIAGGIAASMMDGA